MGQFLAGFVVLMPLLDLVLELQNLLLPYCEVGSELRQKPLRRIGVAIFALLPDPWYALTPVGDALRDHDTPFKKESPYLIHLGGTCLHKSLAATMDGQDSLLFQVYGHKAPIRRATAAPGLGIGCIILVCFPIALRPRESLCTGHG